MTVDGGPLEALAEGNSAVAGCVDRSEDDLDSDGDAG